MRIILLMLFTVYSIPGQAQVREVNRIDFKVDMAELQKKDAHFEKTRVLAVNDKIAIGQIGIVDIVLFDLKSGNVIKSIDTDIIIKTLEASIHRLLGEQYYVPDNQENLRSTYVGVLPYDFRGLFYLKEKEKFVTKFVATVFNRSDVQFQMLLPCLVFFDKNLGNIEIIPFDPSNSSTNSAWLNGGFFLGQDRLFTKMMAWKHEHDFDFIEYRLTEDNIYTIADTLFGIKTNTAGYPGRFHNCFAFHDKNYINLGSKLYAFEGGNIKEGHLLPFPHKVERNFLYVEPYDENHLVAYAINDYRKDPEPTGWLFLLDKDLTITKVIDKFDLDDAVFCSIFVVGKSVFVANYDEKNEKYFLLKYEDF